MAIVLPELAAAAPFYGAPPLIEDIQKIRAPMLAIYAEIDRNLTSRMPPVILEMNARQVSYGIHIYQGVSQRHGWCLQRRGSLDAWGRTINHFNRYLRRPRE